jgi:hypothetical protein
MLVSGANHKNKLAEVVSYEIVPEIHVAELLKSLPSPNIELTIMSWGSNFQNKWNLTTATPNHWDPDHFNPLKAKRIPLYLKTQSVPRSKHFLSRL